VTAKNVAVTAAQRVATIASAVATQAYTGAQIALNAVLAANPIALAVIALVALAAAVVVAYKKSETFREIADTVFSAVADVVTKPVDAVRGLIGWVKDKLPDAVRHGKQVIVPLVLLMIGPYLLIGKAVSELIGWVADRLPDAARRGKDAAAAALELLIDPIQAIIDAVQSVIRFIRDHVRAAFDAVFGALLKPINAVADAIQDVIDLAKDAVGWVGDLADKAGDIGGDIIHGGILGPLGGVLGISGGTSAAPIVQNVVTVNGAVDKLGTADQVAALLDGRRRWAGQLVTT
jgi:phage-related protein